MDKSNDKRRCVALSELQPGDYVVSIKGTRAFRLKQPGYMDSEAAMQVLWNAGVTHVWIDPERSRQENVAPPELAAAPEEPTDFDSLAQSRALYLEAREIMARFYDMVRDGVLPNVEQAQQYASHFVEGVFSNPTTLACLTRIREKDAYLMERSLNVSILMALFARHLGIDKKTTEILALGALLHDIGKVRVPESILMKPGRLSDDEFEIMKSHVTHAVSMLEEQGEGLPTLVMDVVANHHERLDGEGYPKGLKAGQLSRYARMISIVDVYDALTAERVYKPAMPPTKALRLLLDLSGAHFDRVLVEQFIRCMGVYPVGSLVRLASGRLAIVTKANEQMPVKPQVKIIFNTRNQSRIVPEELNLLFSRDSIEGAEDPAPWGLNINEFIAAEG